MEKAKKFAAAALTLMAQAVITETIQKK